MGRNEDDAVRRVLDGALDAVIATGGDGGIVGWNRAAEALLGWTKADVVGRKVYDVIIAARHRERFVREMRAVAPEDLRVSYRDCVVVDREGTEIPVDASVAATRVDGCVLITAFVRDIRDRKRTERLREAEHRLARLLAEAPDGRELLVRSQPILATGLGWATI